MLDTVEKTRSELSSDVGCAGASLINRPGELEVGRTTVSRGNVACSEYPLWERPSVGFGQWDIAEDKGRVMRAQNLVSRD